MGAACDGGASALHVAAIEGQLEAAVLDARDDEHGMPPAAWANEKGREATADRSVLTREREWGSVVHAACMWGRVGQGFTPLEIGERQAAENPGHTSILLEGRRREIQRDCARIVERLRAL
jgi:hypothetical protein